MNRGELVTVAARDTYSGKPRPTLIVQSDLFAHLASITVCLLTTEHIEAPLLRLELEPHTDNGLARPCQGMIDKLMTVPRSSIGQHIGTLDRDDVLRVDRALALSRHRIMRSGVRLRLGPGRHRVVPTDLARRKASLTVEALRSGSA